MFQLSTIWAETSDNARSAARSLVLGGLSDKHHGMNNFWVADRINVRQNLKFSSLQFSETNIISGYLDLQDIDLEALRILNMCYERAKEVNETFINGLHLYYSISFILVLLNIIYKRIHQILGRNRTLMDEVVEKLVQKKSLSKQEFFTLVELYGSIKAMPPSILELRKIKRLELEETVMKLDMTTATNSS